MAANPSVTLGPIGNRATLPQLPLSDCITHGVLVASTAKIVSVPGGAAFAAVIFPADVYVTSDGSTPTVPAGDDTGSTKFCIPGGSARVFPILSGNDLKILSATAGPFSVEFFK